MLLRRATAVLLLLFGAFVTEAQQDFSTMLRWRNIGPFRGGRVRAVSGVPSQPSVFYFAQVNGGVFKTTDYGRTWQPIFDDQPTGSVGAIAVSISNPEIVYVGSGEGLHRPDLSIGDGIYKSTDAGKTWTHLGLRDGQPVAAKPGTNCGRVFPRKLSRPTSQSRRVRRRHCSPVSRRWSRRTFFDRKTGANPGLARRMICDPRPVSAAASYRSCGSTRRILPSFIRPALSVGGR